MSFVIHSFEIENSLALYHLLDRICDRDGERSFYSRRFRALLDSIRNRFKMPIALLAVTYEKYEAMRATEFGKTEGERLTDDEVRELSGFDFFWGPDKFDNEITRAFGTGSLLYVRASDPVAKLKDPKVRVDHPLLASGKLRGLIKRAAITINIDGPHWPVGDPRRINDTKRYMPPMGIALEIHDESELAIATRRYGDVRLRAKPSQGTYGCYGHVVGMAADAKFRKGVRRGLRDRGSYLIQPEYPAPLVLNAADNVTYAYIDRVFFGMMDTPQFLGGFREFLPSDSQEAKMGRLHGNKDTVFASIVPA